jgi:hypothetical protein
MTRKILFPLTALVLSAGSGCGALMSVYGDDPDDCTKSVDSLTAMDSSDPPAANLDGRWTCYYDLSNGEAATEYLTMTQDGDKVTMTGRNNQGENLVLEGRVSGDRFVSRYGKLGGHSTKIGSGGRLLDGTVLYFSENDGSGRSSCHKSRYTCRRVQ